MQTAIPIRNLYALLAFCWRDLGVEVVPEVGTVLADTPLEMLARVMVEGTRALLRRGLHREYEEHAEDLSAVRGAIDLGVTVARATSVHRRLHCRFDELVPDVAANRLVKACVRVLLTTDGIEVATRHALGGLLGRLADITDVPLPQADAADVRVPRGARAYAPLIDLCRMLARHLLPDQDGRGRKFRDPFASDDELARLFEGFVRGFASHHFRLRHDVDVRAAHVPWAGRTGSAAALELLPRMKTDVTIRAPHRVAVLECKFVRSPFRELEYAVDRIKLRSGHLYQLFAYVTNLERAHPEQRVRGALLYASTGRGVDEHFALANTELSVRTIDLSLSWPELERVMTEVVDHAAF